MELERPASLAAPPVADNGGGGGRATAWTRWEARKARRRAAGGLIRTRRGGGGIDSVTRGARWPSTRRRARSVRRRCDTASVGRREAGRGGVGLGRPIGPGRGPVRLPFLFLKKKLVQLQARLQHNQGTNTHLKHPAIYTHS